MAKKNAGKSKPPKTAKKPKAPARARKAGPRSQPLPGMGQVRNAKLVNLCESLSETRAELARLHADEAGDMQAALTEMHNKGLTSYHHAGVELSRVPGVEKLRVRVVSKDKASAEAETDEPDGDEGADSDQLEEATE